MKSKIFVRFWLHKSKMNSNGEHPIYMRVRIDGEFFIKSIGRYIKPSTWDKSAMKVKGMSNDATLINNQIDTLKVNVYQIFNQYNLLGKPFSVFDIKSAIEGKDKYQLTLIQAFNEHITDMTKLLGKGYELVTINSYNITKRRIKQFLQAKYKRNDINLYELNLNFINEFEVFLRDKYNNSSATCYKHYQRIAKVLNKSMERGYIEKFPFSGYKLRMPKKQIEYLTKNEISRIEALEFTIERLNIIRDIFIFCCYTGLAYCEVESVTRINIIEGIDGSPWLKLIRKKTKREYQVPLLPKALSIIDKYESHPKCIQSGKLLPVPSNVKYNAYLKEIADLSGIEKNLTTHIARKTFASTIMLANGVNIAVLSKFLGHSSIQITLDSYATVIDELILSNIKMLKSKLPD